MSSLHYSELCRLCLVNERVSIPIFDGESGIQSLCLKIGTCLPIKVSPEDILPKNICNDCFYKVENQYQFWISTANAEKQLLQWFSNSNSAPTPEVVKGLASMGADQNNFKTEMDLDPSSELSKSLSQVEAVLAGETSNVPEKEDDDEEEDESEEEGSNSEESDDDGDNAADDGAKDDGDSDEAYDEELEPTTFVNVSFECDEAGPSGTQQQQRAPTAPSTSTSAPAPSGTELILREEKSLQSLPNILATPEKRAALDESSPNSVLISKYLCHVCKAIFGDINVLTRHKLTHAHTRTVAFNYVPKRFECEVCQKVFAEKGILNAHKVSHSSERHFLCSVCNKAYKRNVELKRHMMIHTGQKDHACNVCDYATLDNTALQNHKKRVHSSICEYTCDRCGKRFSTSSDLNSHKRIHREKKLKCLNCDKGFHVQRDFVSHMETHDPSCVNQCDVCLKLFATKQTLCRHLQTHL